MGGGNCLLGIVWCWLQVGMFRISQGGVGLVVSARVPKENEFISGGSEEEALGRGWFPEEWAGLRAETWNSEPQKAEGTRWTDPCPQGNCVKGTALLELQAHGPKAGSHGEEAPSHFSAPSFLLNCASASRWHTLLGTLREPR